jgi:tetratricopeptide (TPR) repeat protein
MRIGGVAFCLLLVWAVGCNNSLPPHGQQLLASGKQSYERKQYDQALATLDAFMSQYGGRHGADEALLYRGMAKAQRGDRAGAMSDLRQASAIARTPALRTHAQYNLANIAYEAGDMGGAAEAFRQALAQADSDPSMLAISANGHYRLGVTLQRQGKWAEADPHFHRVGFLSPDSDVARQAARHANCRAWTVQAGSLGARQAAEAMSAALKRLSLAATVQPDRSPQPRFVVYVGRFEQYGDAVEQLREVAKHQSDAFVTAIP